MIAFSVMERIVASVDRTGRRSRPPFARDRSDRPARRTLVIVAAGCGLSCALFPRTAWATTGYSAIPFLLLGIIGLALALLWPASFVADCLIVLRVRGERANGHVRKRTRTLLLLAVVGDVVWAAAGVAGVSLVGMMLAVFSSAVSQPDAGANRWMTWIVVIVVSKLIAAIAKLVWFILSFRPADPGTIRRAR